MSLSPSAQRIQDLLTAGGYGARVQELPDSTRTAGEAAATVGCTVAQIGKSLIFRGEPSGRSILVVASGINRVDERKVAAAIGERLGKADADFVREKTGFAIGRVPPFGHAEPPLVILDEDLMTHAELWVAAGTPRAVFRVTPDELAALAGGQILAVRKA